ncbi:hypothetical protein TELCIR_19532, partial [Teladorsagia circumcincta]
VMEPPKKSEGRNFLPPTAQESSQLRKSMDCDIASYHVDSFNYLVEEGVHLAAQSVPAEKFRLPSGEAVELRYTGASLAMPTLETE